ALRRVELADHLDKVYCFRNVGFRKPSQEFFNFILKDLDLLPEEVIMVGDDWEADVQGAAQAGLRAIWLNMRSTEHCTGSGYQTIHSLLDLPQTLTQWGFR
ncbi:MAG: HAD-superfamily hydrolase, subfamily variant 3, partial [Chloroflexi bacterium]|nr:HAD-superfamily hydrolase, subfamily variant 3 [Chloroflexota bacterium]